MYGDYYKYMYVCTCMCHGINIIHKWQIADSIYVAIGILYITYQSAPSVYIYSKYVCKKTLL